ncbi:MAG TPA: DUF3016 domain-containing protein [Opitutaceae bacterium]|jgi:hypothetical protein
MKTLRLLPALLGLAAASPLLAAPNSRTVVIFDHPENFSDVRDGYFPSDKGREAILSEIRDDVVDCTRHLLPQGDTLKVTFTDIHLAGDFRPDRGPGWDEVRIVKDIYPPSFKFSWAVSDPSGHVVKQGSEDIRDLNFQYRMTLDVTDPLRYEKAILNDWARESLGSLKRS